MRSSPHPDPIHRTPAGRRVLRTPHRALCREMIRLPLRAYRPPSCRNSELTPFKEPPRLPSIRSRQRRASSRENFAPRPCSPKVDHRTARSASRDDVSGRRPVSSSQSVHFGQFFRCEDDDRRALHSHEAHPSYRSLSLRRKEAAKSSNADQLSSSKGT